MSSALVVTAFPRLHFGLLDVGHATQRKYGGIGVVLDWPVYEIGVAPAAELSFRGFSALDAAASEDLQAATKRYLVSNGLQSCRIDLRKPPIQHVGLGSKTALVLAILAGLNDCFSLGHSTIELQLASGRGVVSGIGVHGFFSGGLIVDAGQPQDGLPHLPSSLASGAGLSLLQLRNSISESWLFYLVLPNGRRYSGLEERDLFRKLTPIPPTDAYEAISLVYHGIVPAFANGELQSLRLALRRFAEIGFKAREISVQTPETRALLRELHDLDTCAAGMSSVGPLIYAVSNLDRNIVEPKIQSLCAQSGATVLNVCAARNGGYSLQRDA